MINYVKVVKMSNKHSCQCQNEIFILCNYMYTCNYQLKKKWFERRSTAKWMKELESEWPKEQTNHQLKEKKQMEYNKARDHLSWCWITQFVYNSALNITLFLQAKVVRTKSTESMPFVFSFMMVFVSFLWFCYGTTVEDINIQVKMSYSYTTVCLSF